MDIYQSHADNPAHERVHYVQEAGAGGIRSCQRVWELLVDIRISR